MINEIRSAASQYRPSQVRAARPMSSVSSPAVAGGTGTDDQVQISELAYWRSKLDGTPEVREDLIASVRQQILAGAYDSDDKLDLAIDRMMGDLGL